MAGKPDTDTIYETLRDRVCLLDYPPGTILRETELAQEFGVSRTPIRAVLQRLAHGRLVAPKDGVGTIVTEPDAGEIRDIYEMRLKVAELIGQMSPLPLTDNHARDAEAIQRQARVLLTHFDIRTYWQINHRLHFLISGVIGNGALREVWDNLYFQSARFWYQYARSDPGPVAHALIREIEDVIRAIRVNDPVALGYVQRNSIAAGLALLIR